MVEWKKLDGRLEGANEGDLLVLRSGRGTLTTGIVLKIDDKESIVRLANKVKPTLYFDCFYRAFSEYAIINLKG